MVKSKTGKVDTELTENQTGETKMKHPSYEEVATDYELWCDYVDPGATMTEEQFDEMTTEEKVQMQIECFGDEEQQSEE